MNKFKLSIFSVLFSALLITLISSKSYATDAINNSIESLINRTITENNRAEDRRRPSEIDRILSTDILSEEQEEKFAPPLKSQITKNPNSTLSQEQAEEKNKQKIKKAKMQDRKYVVLRSIDKVTARTTTFEIPIGKTVKFADVLFIRARACKEASPLSQPESASFLEIWEKKQELDKAEWIFSGWMFASSPGLSAMNHPIFDVWVTACKNSSTIASKSVVEDKDSKELSEKADSDSEDKSESDKKN